MNLSWTNKQNYDEMLEYLYNFCTKHHIRVVNFTNQEIKNTLGHISNSVSDTSQVPSFSFPNTIYGFPCIFINLEYYKPLEIPFMVAHEIGHILEGNPDNFIYLHNGISQEERQANLFAINLIDSYASERNYHYSSIYQFAQCFNIPNKYYYLLTEVKHFNSIY
ncbi:MULTISPECIES: ImmA/IrrE family metallo-endopeptidase [unclassified Lactobacillus]|uniref:ImmA/IrrE family metallo-endopeptidase n=1 Tax=unclassified Lactobacillus TaxID=2620435 RepID=UPI002240DC0A|nr:MULTISPECIES: ImmA/IrrE family metallo-endopeptidase [unclassified Lactobacillus]